jgi:antitoxin (DNA-binding transcriptional repressor) of toxin-antitoxin stability system
MGNWCPFLMNLGSRPPCPNPLGQLFGSVPLLRPTGRNRSGVVPVDGAVATVSSNVVIYLSGIFLETNLFQIGTLMAIIAMKGNEAMRSVNVAKLKNQLSKYLTFAKGGEEIVIRDRNLPVAKLVPFSTDEGSEEELLLVAAGKMRLPKAEVKLAELARIPTGTVASNEAIAALVGDREESL